MTETPPSPTGTSGHGHGHPGQGQPLKRRRITRACDRCHKGGIKCSPSSDPGTCSPCAAFGSVCTYERPVKRRGPAAKPTTPGDHHGHGHGHSTHGGHGQDHGHSHGHGRDWQLGSSSGSELGERKAPGAGVGSVSDTWRPINVASSEIIEELVEGYHRIVYPILPYFHWPTFSYDVRRRRYLHDRPFYAATMAVCAIASARLRDGARLPHITAREFPASEIFYDAAISALPRDLLEAGDFDYKRTKALLMMLNVQYGRVKEVKLQLGELITMFSLEGFHNESRWPPGLNPIEVEERRRLFWAIYQSDVYVAVIWGSMAQLRESQITVGYPTEVFDDNEITSSGFLPPHRAGSTSSTRRSNVSFFQGWNFVCDLYRILEHAADRLRASRTGTSGSAGVDEVMGLYTRKAGPDPAEVMSTVAGMYANLPLEFKRVKAMTGNLEEDRYGFTATNIIICLQTLRSVIAGTEEANVHQRCSIAAEMLDALASVPTPYIQAASAPMLHHLAGVGHLLGSIIQSPLSQHTYLRVRTVLLALADMLSSLEVALSRDSNIATRLRAHVFRIDNYMTEAASHQHQQQPGPLGLADRGGGGGGGGGGGYLPQAQTYIPSLYPPAASNTRTAIHNTIAPPSSGINHGNSSSNNINGSALNGDNSSNGARTSGTANLPLRIPLAPNDLLPTPSTATGSAAHITVEEPSTSALNLPSNTSNVTNNNIDSDSSPFPPNDWAPSVNVSPTQQFQLPDDLFQDWPFDIGQGDVFDWLGDLQGGAGAGEVSVGQTWNGN